MKDDTRYTCASCKKFDCCGWSNIEPKNLHKISKKLATNEPCENFCEPSKYKASEMQNEAVFAITREMANSAKNDLEVSLKKKKKIEEEMAMLEDMLMATNDLIHCAKWFLPESASENIEKSVRDQYGKVEINHPYCTAKEYIARLENKISLLECEIKDLLAEREALFADLTSCIASYSAAPGGGGDSHPFDGYVELSAEIDARCGEIIKLKKKIAKVKKINKIE